MRVVLFDDMDGQYIYPDIDRAPITWCDECQKRSTYRYDRFGYRECLECNKREDEHDDHCDL